MVQYTSKSNFGSLYWLGFHIYKSTTCGFVHYDTFLQKVIDIITKSDSFFITKCDNSTTKCDNYYEMYPMQKIKYKLFSYKKPCTGKNHG